MTDKDYTLLRPFDEEAAKRGEAIYMGYDGEIVKFIAGPDAVGDYVVLPDGGEFGFHKALRLAMAPLRWVEGKPVYKGDKLYVRPEAPCNAGMEFVVDSANGDNVYAGWHWTTTENLTWTKPLEDGWITWNGGERPVPCGTLVNVRYRFGPEKQSYKAEKFRWKHYGNSNDIVAYRMVKQPKPVKRWINVYLAAYEHGVIHVLLQDSKEQVDEQAKDHRIACIEIELPPLEK